MSTEPGQLQGSTLSGSPSNSPNKPTSPAPTPRSISSSNYNNLAFVSPSMTSAPAIPRCHNWLHSTSTYSKSTNHMLMASGEAHSAKSFEPSSTWHGPSTSEPWPRCRNQRTPNTSAPNRSRRGPGLPHLEARARGPSRNHHHLTISISQRFITGRSKECKNKVIWSGLRHEFVIRKDHENNHR